jgi:hypothetical protein
MPFPLLVIACILAAVGGMVMPIVPLCLIDLRRLRHSLGEIRPAPELDRVRKSFVRDTNRFFDGFKAIIPNIRRAQTLQRIKKEKGETALSFSEYQFLSTHREDRDKMLRILFALPMSPELSFYSYIVVPMMKPTNPFAWKSFPSFFQRKKEIEVRKAIVDKRRTQTVVSVQAIPY